MTIGGSAALLVVLASALTAPGQAHAAGSVVVTSKPAVVPVARRAVVAGKATGRALRTGRVRAYVVRLSGPGRGASALISRKGMFRVRLPATARVGTTRYKLVIAKKSRAAFSVRTIAAPPGPGTGVTHVVASGQILGAPAPGEGGQVRLAAGSTMPAVGDTLNAGIGPKTPYGMLLRVTSVSTTGGVVANTVPARLDEVLPDGRLAPTIPISASAGRTLTRARAATGASCDGSTGFTIEGSAEVSGGIEPVLEWGILKPKRAGLIAEASASASASVQATATGSCTLDEIELLDKTLTPVTFPVGPVVVVLVPEIEVDLNGSIEAQAAMGASVSAGISARAGLVYEDGDFTKVADVEREFSHEITEPSANGTATGTITTELSVLVYGAVGPTVTIESGLQFGADTTADPWWWLDATLAASATLELPILDVSSDPLELYSETFRLAQAPRNLLDVTMTETTARLGGSGSGSIVGPSGSDAQTSQLDAGIAQREPVTESVESDATEADFAALPVEFDDLPSANTTYTTTQACPVGTTSSTSVLVPTAGGNGEGEISVEVQLDGGEPVGLLVLDHGNEAHTIIREAPDALLATWRTDVKNCDGTTYSTDTTQAVHHGTYLIPGAFSPLAGNATFSSLPPEVTITFVGCDSEGACTYDATYARSYTHTEVGWSASSLFTLETSIVVEHRMG